MLKCKLFLCVLYGRTGLGSGAFHAVGPYPDSMLQPPVTIKHDTDAGKNPAAAGHGEMGPRL